LVEDAPSLYRFDRDDVYDANRNLRLAPLALNPNYAFVLYRRQATRRRGGHR
jgi:hypothetical protein